MFIDTHAHLTDNAFKDDKNEVVKKSFDCGVEFVITSGFNLKSSKEALKFAQEKDNVFCSIGVYPENILELDDDTLAELEKMALDKKVIAIGEIGLQYTDNMPPREKQKEGFVRQLKLAHKLGLPVVIHCRDAYGDMLELLNENKEYLKFGGTMHCYCGSKEIAQSLIKLGLHISVGGVSTFKNASKLREALKEIPLSSMLLETDCPYLAPHPYRGERNAPFYIPTTAENLAKLKEVEVEEVAKTTTKNARELFKI